MKRTGRRLLSVLLGMCMLLSLLPVMPGTAKAAPAPRTDPLDCTALDTNQDQLSSEGWAWYKTASLPYNAKTLVLNGLNLEATPTSSKPISYSPYYGSLIVPDGTTIVLNGNNTIKATKGSITENITGILAEGTLTITGNGIPSSSLNVSAEAGSGGYKINAGIVCSGDLTIEQAKVTAQGGDRSAAEGLNTGIWTGSALQLESTAELIAQGGKNTNAGNSTGIYFGGSTGGATIEGKATFEGGEVISSGTNGGSYGIWGDVLVTVKPTAEMIVKANNAPNISQGISGALTLDGDGSVDITTGSALKVYGVYSSSYPLSITDGKLDIKITDANAVNATEVYGVRVPSIAVSGGELSSVTGNSNAANSWNYALYAAKGSGISITGTGKVTATAGNADSTSYGAYLNHFHAPFTASSSGDVTLSGKTSAVHMGSTDKQIDYGTSNRMFAGKATTYTVPSKIVSSMLVDAANIGTAIQDAKLVDAYKVTYNGNGSTEGTVPAEAAYLVGASVTVSGNTGTLKKTGSDFDGWNESQDGTGTNHAPSSTFTMGAANKTLYAKWKSTGTYTVTYDANGGIGIPMQDSKKYAKDEDVTVMNIEGLTAPAGTTFAGWNTRADGNGTTHAVWSTFKITQDTTLYAQWVKDTPTPPTPPTPVTSPSLSVSAPSFSAQTVGYTARPAAQPLVISNTGDALATISSVSVNPATAFDVSGSGSTVAVGGSISSWNIQPKADLPKGSHSATITVSYTGGRTATATVSFAVVDSDAPTPDPEVEPIRAIQASSGQEVDLILKVLKFIGDRYPVTIRIIDRNGKTWLVKDGVVLAVTDEAAAKQATAPLVKAKSVGNVEFKLTPKELAQLPEGEYTLWLSSEGNALNQPMPETKVGVLLIRGRTTWSVPQTFKATAGISYQLVTNTDAESKPTIKVSTNKPETISIDEYGRITGTLHQKAEDNVANVVFEDEKGNTKTSIVTVAANWYARELPLRLSGKLGVFSSTKLMHYNGKNLEVEAFLLNKRKSKTLYKAGRLALVIYKNGTPIYRKDLSTWRMTTPLRYNGRAIYKVTITPEDLKKYGAAEGPYDLASGAYEVVLTRPSNVTAVLGNESNIVVQKGIEVKDMIIRSTGGMPMMENEMG